MALKKRKLFYVSLILAFFFLTLTAWLFIWRQRQQASSRPSQSIGLPNPAAVYCQKSGYRYVIKTKPAGQYGLCIFPNGHSCDAWQFYRGQCSPSLGAKKTTRP